jgi:hypothetical protein
MSLLPKEMLVAVIIIHHFGKVDAIITIVLWVTNIKEWKMLEILIIFNN